MVERAQRGSETVTVHSFESNFLANLSHFIEDQYENLNTRSAYTEDLRQFSQFLISQEICDFNQINPQTIGAFFNSLKESMYTSSTLARKSSVIRSFLYWLNKNGQFSNQATLEAKDLFPAASKNILSLKSEKPLTSAKFEKIRQESSPRKKLLVYLLTSGLRSTQVSELRLSNLNLDEQILTVETLQGRGRNKKNHTFKIALDKTDNEEFADYLCERRKADSREDPPLFIKKRGEHDADPLTRQGIWVIVKDSGKRVGIDNLSPRILQKSSGLFQNHPTAQVSLFDFRRN